MRKFILFVYYGLGNIALPLGLQWVQIISPILIVSSGSKTFNGRILLAFLSFLVFCVVQVLLIEPSYMLDYIISFFVLVLNISIAWWVTEAIIKSTSHEKFGLGLGLVALILFGYYFFYGQVFLHGLISKNIEEISRFRGFSFEPSYFATMLVPIFSLSIQKIIYSKGNVFDWLGAFFLAFAIIATLSFGVISLLGLAVLISLASCRKSKRSFTFAILIWLVIVLIGYQILSSDNIFSSRLNNVLVGDDSSFRNRFFESSWVMLMIFENGDLFGLGLGQPKYLIADYFSVFWDEVEISRMTNSVAGLGAIFGVPGLVVKFSLLFFLFFRYRIYRDFSALTCFLFMFSYQFTGSFFFSIAEYVIWFFCLKKGNSGETRKNLSGASV